MMGTVILTGANSSAGVPATEYLLKAYPELTLVLTVRNASPSDQNTSNLRDVLSQYPGTKTSIHELDLADLSRVHDFARRISSSIAEGALPHLASIICNAFYWNLVDSPRLTVDGYDETLQIGHIAHVALVLRLIGQFAPDGRVVILSSINHWPGKSPMEKHPAEIPSDLNTLAHPNVDSDHQARGMERYSNAKLIATTWMYALNRHLEKTPNFNRITAVAINPGTLVDSRAFRTNTPSSIVNMQRFMFRPFQAVLRRFVDPSFRRASEASVAIVELATNQAHPGERGYFNFLEKDQSSPQSLDERTQERVWVQSAAWAKITKGDTALQGDFE